MEIELNRGGVWQCYDRRLPVQTIDFSLKSVVANIVWFPRVPRAPRGECFFGRHSSHSSNARKAGCRPSAAAVSTGTV